MVKANRQKWIFIGGNTGGGGEEIRKLRRENQELKEQNNLLEFKFQVLLDLVTRSQNASN